MNYNKLDLLIPKKYKLFLLLLPFLIFITIFCYLPLFGWIYAFFNYRPGIPLKLEDFVGFKWFISMIETAGKRKEVIRVLRNTLAISGLAIATSWCPMVFAILLSEIRFTKFKRVVQTLTTLPNFISWVLVYAFAFTLLSVDAGLINRLLIDLGVIDKGINYLLSSENIWIKMTLWSMWKGLGWGAIMYFAALSSIDPQLYEAAQVDGAGRFRQIWHITIPGLLPTYFVLLLLSFANLVNNGMEQYYVFQNAMNRETIEVLDLYVYNVGLGGTGGSSAGTIPFATAVSMLKSLVSVALLFAANGLSKLFRGESIV
jgi:putative aldouronate transport system permease protein